jgi:hypothetical protein
MANSRLLGQFRISSGMRPYVLRIRLRGPDFEFGATPERAVAFTKCIREMRRILVEKCRVSMANQNGRLMPSRPATTRKTMPIATAQAATAPV